MEWLWSRWPEVAERLSRSKSTLLLLDYDGTLAPIAPVPEQAALPSETKAVLRRLARSPRVTVAVVSGRAVTEVRRLVGLRNVTYIGNHGLEITFNGRRTAIGVPGPSREALARIRSRLAQLAAGVPGARIEDKGLAVSLHYRLVHRNRVARLKAAFRHDLLPFIQAGALTVLNGKKVLEVRPNVSWTKGHAALWLVKRLRRKSLLTIYIGDDTTDEDAFGMLKGGMTVRVGFHRRSKAAYYVRGIREVLSLLRWLAAPPTPEALVVTTPSLASHDGENKT